MMKTKTKTIPQLKAEIEKTETERIELIEQIDPIRKKISRLYDKRNKLEEQLSELEIAKLRNRKTVDWKYVLFEDGHVSGTRYEYRDEMIRSIGLDSNGYNPDIQQSVIRIALVKGDPKSLETHLKGLRKVLPHLNEVRKGVVIVDIMEEGLSRHESWYLEINKIWKTYKVVPKYRPQYSIKGTFKSLKKALEFIQDKVWYASTDPTDYPTEDD